MASPAPRPTNGGGIGAVHGSRRHHRSVGNGHSPGTAPDPRTFPTGADGAAEASARGFSRNSHPMSEAAGLRTKRHQKTGDRAPAPAKRQPLTPTIDPTSILRYPIDGRHPLKSRSTAATLAAAMPGLTSSPWTPTSPHVEVLRLTRERRLPHSCWPRRSTECGRMTALSRIKHPAWTSQPKQVRAARRRPPPFHERTTNGLRVSVARPSPHNQVPEKSIKSR